MASKKNKARDHKPTDKKTRPKESHGQPGSRRNINLPNWMLPVLVIVTFIAFIPVLQADFVSLDDNEYVTQNPYLNAAHLKELIITPLQGNYHPLTMLSLYFNHLISGNDAWSYHLLNLLLHIVNCVLVFRLALLLGRKNLVIAFTAAILFAIHPMRVESVAWISERKDVLYGVFFLAGLISYVKYIDTQSRKQYALAIVFLLLSLLSKPAAVIFPVTLFCVDLLRKRQFNFKLLIEKMPFFLLAMGMGILTIIGQKEAGATGIANFSMLTKILFAFYGIMMYIVKLIAPVNLAVFYRYPAGNESLSAAYYIAPIFFVVLAVIVFLSFRKSRVPVFGISFYLVNLLLVLQLIPVGSAVISERYTYLPYIGLFYIIGWMIDGYAKNNVNKSLVIIAPLSLLFVAMTWKQSTVWQSSAKLWDNAIKNQPSYKAYANRARLLRDEKNYDLSLQYFKEAIRLNIDDYESYNNRGNVYFDMKKYELAEVDYRYAIKLKPDYYPALDNLGTQFAVRGIYDSALKYFNLSLKYKPDYKTSYSNRGLLFMQLNRFEDAIKDWEKYLEFEPGAADVYSLIGDCYQALKKYPQSLDALNKAIQLQPQAAEFYLRRAITYMGLQNLEAAKKDAEIAKTAGVQLPPDLANYTGIK
jgi:protein O-mannosyl-transferase